MLAAGSDRVFGNPAGVVWLGGTGGMGGLSSQSHVWFLDPI